MKVIFLKDVKKQAKKDEIKEVKDGYAKYLISNSLAVAYTPGSIDVLKGEIKQREKEEELLVEKYNEIKNKLNDKDIVFKVKTGTSDRVFGSISTKQIAEELSKMGYKIDKKCFKLEGDINSLGTHRVLVTLHKKVSFNINVVLNKLEG